MRASHLALAALATLLAGTGAASAAGQVRGNIVSISPQQIVVSSVTGDKTSFAITPATGYVAERSLALSAIQPGSYIGSAAVSDGPGKLRALEVTVFPPSMKGVGEGHYAWDLTPHSTMTNGTVGDLKHAHGDVLTVTYYGGEQTILVPPGTPIVTVAPGSYVALQPGMRVVVFPDPHNPTAAGQIAYGENGMTPPQ